MWSSRRKFDDPLIEKCLDFLSHRGGNGQLRCSNEPLLSLSGWLRLPPEQHLRLRTLMHCGQFGETSSDKMRNLRPFPPFVPLWVVTKTFFFSPFWDGKIISSPIKNGRESPDHSSDRSHHLITECVSSVRLPFWLYNYTVRKLFEHHLTRELFFFISNRKLSDIKNEMNIL